MSNMTVVTRTNCTFAPDSAESDAGIAGAGILLAFIATAALALLLSAFIVLSDFRSNATTGASRPLTLMQTISRKLLLGLSDQQLISGIAIQSLALARLHNIIPYHFFIIWMLSLLSTATNFGALLALVQDFKRDWVLRWLRQVTMFVNMVLTVVLGVLVLQIQLGNLPQTMAVGCIWDHGFQDLSEKEKAGNSSGNNVLSTVGTIAVITASAVIFVVGSWYLHLPKQTWGRFVRAMSVLVLWAIAVSATARIVAISQAFGSPSVKLSDEGEKSWNFGQLLAMLMLVLPFISALEIYRGEIRVPECVNGRAEVLDSDQLPLTGLGDPDRYTSQSNPWFNK